MSIYVDADACPKVIKETLFRAANRKQVMLVLVANHAISVPPSPFIKSLQVPAGFDIADDEIVKLCAAGDLVITADIPLAAEVIAKGAEVVSPRGEVLSKANIGARLNMRDFMDTMRSSGEHTGGPAPLNQRDRQQFANALDRYLARQ